MMVLLAPRGDTRLGDWLGEARHRNQETQSHYDANHSSHCLKFLLALGRIESGLT